MGRKSICKVCGRESEERNRRGVCLNCAMNKNRAVVRQLREKKGKHYKKWKINLMNAMKKMPM